MADLKVVMAICLEAMVAYPNAPATKEDQAALQRVWWNALKDVPDDMLRQAWDTYCKSKAQWRPPPGTLRQMVLEQSGLLPEQMALTAWEQVRDEVGMRNPHLDDPIAMRALKAMGGFDAFKASDPEKVEWWEKRFVELYKTFAAVQPPSFERLTDGNTKKGISSGTEEQPDGGYPTGGMYLPHSVRGSGQG